MTLNVLIVDDSSLTRKAIKRIIGMVDETADLGTPQFYEAGNGCEALDILKDSQVDLILADMNMPKMGGSEMIGHIKSNESTKSIPIVVVSTESKTARIKELLAKGVKSYLHKPFTPEEFKVLIDELWNKTTEEAVDLLTRALSQVLETTAFSMIMPIDDGMVNPDKTILAEIGFTGPKSGTIQIMAGVELSKLLAQNIAGISDVDDQSACDALKELANITCGLFLPMVVSSTADLFDITIPTTEVCDNSSQWDEFTSAQDSCVLNIEGYAAAVKLAIEDSAIV